MPAQILWRSDALEYMYMCWNSSLVPDPQADKGICDNENNVALGVAFETSAVPDARK